MDRKRFLNQLTSELYFFNTEEIKEIIEEYITIFDERNEEGKTDIEVIKMLDTPKQIANAYSEELSIKISKVDKFFVNSRKLLQQKTNEINNKLNKKKEAVKFKTKVKNSFVEGIITFFKLMLNFSSWLGLTIVFLFQMAVKLVVLSFILFTTIGYLLFVLIIRFSEFNIEIQIFAFLIYISIIYIYLYINKAIGSMNE